jgi:hypothetical protein
MSGKARVWDEIPESERSQGSYQGYYRTTNRGCRAAVQWPSDPGWHQCASSAPKDIGFCPKHRVALGIASEKDLKGQDARIGNTIKRSGIFSVRQFRMLDPRKLEVRNVGKVTRQIVQEAQSSWTDEEIAERFRLALVERPRKDRWSSVRILFKDGRDLVFTADLAYVTEPRDGSDRKLYWQRIRDGFSPEHLDMADVSAIGIERQCRVIHPGEPDYYKGVRWLSTDDFVDGESPEVPQ